MIRQRSLTEDRNGRRWAPLFWLIEGATLTVIVGVVFLLQASEEGYMRRNGVRVTATVQALSSDQESCERCPLVFWLDGQRHTVEETLIAEFEVDESPRRWSPGEALELYVDPRDFTHVIEVKEVQKNVVLGVIAIAAASAFGMWLFVSALRSTHR